jgi:hypothetical protein
LQTFLQSLLFWRVQLLSCWVGSQLTSRSTIGNRIPCPWRERDDVHKVKRFQCLSQWPFRHGLHRIPLHSKYLVKSLSGNTFQTFFIPFSEV